VRKRNIELFIAGDVLMKFTKGRIRQIIAEEIAALEGEDGTAPLPYPKLHKFLVDKLGDDLGSLISFALEFAPRPDQDEIARLTDEMIVAEGRRRMVPVGSDIDKMAAEPDEEEDYSSNPYMTDVPRKYQRGDNPYSRRWDRVAVDPSAEPHGEVRILGDEVKRLSKEAGQSPMEYLKSLGFSPQAASNLLGMAGLFDDAAMGMTFSESKRVRRRRKKR